jgi:hypothetical protein
LGTEARRKASVPYGALNDPIDREKDAGRVYFLVQEWMVQVEEPAQLKIPSLTHSSIAGEGRSHLDTRLMASEEETEKPS